MGNNEGCQWVNGQKGIARNRALVFSLVIGTFLTLMLPFLALPFNVLGMIFTSGKIRKAFGLLAAFSLAMVAYIWMPDSQMDFYRHHQQVQLLAGFNFEKLGSLIMDNLEPLQYLTKFAVAQTGDYNLLQFIVILCGYYELFWFVCDIADLKGLKRVSFSIVLLYVFAAVRFIDFASGLWFNLALINLALGIYLFYFREKKVVSYLFYILAALLHTGVLYIVIPAIIFRHFKIFKKYRLIIMFGIFLAYLSFGAILSLLNSILGSGGQIVGMINNMYNSYFVNGSQYDSLHTGWNMLLPVANIILSIIVAVLCLKRDTMNRYSCFTIYILMCVLASLMNAGVFVRYGFFAAMLTIPLLADFIKNNRNRHLGILIIAVVMMLSSLEMARSLSQMSSVGLLTQFKESLTSSTFEIVENNNG